MIVNLFSKLISKAKGEDFKLDESLTDGYLLSLILSKLYSLAWGCLRLTTYKIAFVHPSSTIKCASKLKFGKNLHIGRNCFIDALSKDGLVFGNTTVPLKWTNRSLKSLK